MRAVILFFIGVYTSLAGAQYGIGLAPAQRCPYSYQPGQGAFAGRDQAANLQGRLNLVRAEMDRVQTQMTGMDSKLARARTDMGRVLNERVITAVEEHKRYRRGYNDYWACPRGRPTPQVAARAAKILPTRGGGAVMAGAVGTTRVYPPDDFCPDNAWAAVVEDGGRVNEQVCGYNIPGFYGRPADDRIRECREGMRDFYAYMDRRMALETRRAQLDAEARAIERQYSHLDERIAEGTYCPYCQSQYHGSYQGSLYQSMLPMNNILGALGTNMWQQQRPVMAAMNPAVPSFPGPGAYPGNPYAAMTPGYMGVTNGVYGAMPGGMAAGGWGCAGTNPMYGNPYAPAVSPFLNSGVSPLVNPYAGSLLNPGIQNSLLMPGYGPGFGPVLGNGINGYNPYSSFANPLLMAGSNNPFQNLGMGNQFGNGIGPSKLPFMGQNSLSQGLMGNSYFSNPYQFNGMGGLYGMGNPYGGMGSLYGMGNPFSGFGNGLGNMYGFNNPYGYGQPNGMYGYNPLGPATLPFIGGGGYSGNPYGAVGQYGYGGMPIGYNNPYSYGPQLDTYYWQMQQMNQRMMGIGNSPYFGGSVPPALPFPGPSYGGSSGFGYGYGGGSPIYNMPGTLFNPLPQQPQIPPLPPAPPAGSVPRPFIPPVPAFQTGSPVRTR